MKKLWAVLLCLVICIGVSPISCLAQDSTTLRFGADGKFKIMVFADCQDGDVPYPKMIRFMNAILDITKPDLVVFTGDNVVTSTESAFKKGVTAILTPVASRNIPYAYTFGNHDSEKGVSKETQHKYYSTIGNCLTYDAVPSLTGFGNCNIPIYASKNDSMAFNLWMIDSNMSISGGYDNVHTDQQAWMRNTQAEITAREGHVVPSMVFQHIIVREINNCLTSGLAFLSGKGSGAVNENPCPPAVNSGEYNTVCQMGNVLAMVTGHDHVNNFVATPGPVDLVSVSGMTYESYGDDSVRGSHLITLDESDLMHYTVDDYFCDEFFVGTYGHPAENISSQPEMSVVLRNSYPYFQTDEKYISAISFYAGESADGGMLPLKRNGYTCVDYDLNKGARGDYIYLGYKLTTNPEDAIRSIRYLVTSSSEMPPTSIMVNNCKYILASMTDLNCCASGSFIYGYYSKDLNAGNPLKSVSFQSSTTVGSGQVISQTTAGSTPANLNNGTKGSAIYCCANNGYTTVTVDAFLRAMNAAEQLAVNPCAKKENVDAFNELKEQAATVKETFLKVNGSPKSQSEIDAMTTDLQRLTALVNSEIEHTFPEDAVCTSERVCTKCQSYFAPTTHELTRTTVPPTCTQEGYVSITCANCSYAEREDVVPALNHYFDASVIENVLSRAATETEWGEETVACVHCTESVTTYIPPLGMQTYPKLTATAGKAVRGRDVQVTVSVSDNPGIAQTQMYLQYDRNVLTLLSAEDYGLLGEGAFKTASDLDVFPFVAQWSNPEATNANGKLVTFTFHVKEDAPIGEAEMQLFLKSLATVDAQGVPLKLAVENMAFSVETHIPGDSNGDGKCNLQDVVLIERYLATGWNVTVDEVCADVNADGVIDLKDAVLIKRYLVGGWGVTLK